MRIFFTAILFSLITVTVTAQQVSPLVPLSIPESGKQVTLGNDVILPMHDVAEEVRQSLFYFDFNLPIAVRQIPMSIGTGVTLVLLGQRFTSPAEATYLDSVRIFFPTITSGDIKLLILKDTLLDIGLSEEYHFPNVGTEYAVLDTFRILREDVTQGSNHRVTFSGTPMPDEWHVVFSPVDRGDVLPAYTIAMSMDSVLTSSVMPENGRVTFFYVVTGGGTGSGIYIEGTSAQGYSYLPNLVMSASVRYETGTGVGDVPGVQSMSIKGLYPHPVSHSGTGSPTMAFYLDKPQNIRVAVYDIMGRKVRNAFAAFMPAGNQLVNLSVSDLRPGTYQVRMEGANTVATRTMVIVE